MLAPLVAACGGVVPMISGRGLGHTGGTLDKLESIPGYDATPSEELFRAAVGQAGCAVIGQTSALAPADRRLYAIRDVTATVESIALITASILSKKLAADLDALAMDVKFGSGAFMTDLGDATELAQSIVDVAEGAGLRTTALLTDMNQVLGRSAGNAVEVLETVEWLTGSFSDDRLDEVVYALGAEMLVLGGLAPDLGAAREQLAAARASGAAAERFEHMVAALGGPSDILRNPRLHLAPSPIELAVTAPAGGWVSSIDVRAVGMAVVALGGGRSRAGDAVDHSVGLTRIAALGEHVAAGSPLAIVHARTESDADSAAAILRSAFALSPEALPPGAVGPVVLRRVIRS
jgi:thymidine phosphorylase